LYNINIISLYAIKVNHVAFKKQRSSEPFQNSINNLHNPRLCKSKAVASNPKLKRALASRPGNMHHLLGKSSIQYNNISRCTKCQFLYFPVPGTFFGCMCVCVRVVIGASYTLASTLISDKLMNVIGVSSITKQDALDKFMGFLQLQQNLGYTKAQ